MGENSQIVFIETKSQVPREFYIKKEDLEEHGYTRGCGGCSSVFRGLARQPHNDVCRERLRSILKEGAKVKNAEGRRKDFEDKELEKIYSRWELGIFVGVRRRSGEVWVVVKGKILSARSVRRIPVEHRWGEDCLSWVDRVPWNSHKEALDADGKMPEDLLVEARPVEGNAQIVFIETKSKVPREFYIKKEDLEEHGYTRGCGGCSSVFRGLARQPHNDVCRERLRGILKEGAKVKNAEGRRKDFEDKELEKKRKKEERREDIRREEKRSRNKESGGAAVQTPSSAEFQGEQVPDAEMSIDEVARLVGIWVNEVEQSGEGNADEENMGIMQEAWDDVNGGELPMKEIKKARKRGGN